MLTIFYLYFEFCMQELFYLLSILFITSLWLVALQDYKNKLIYLRSFYLLNIVSIAYFFTIDKNGLLKFLLIGYFFIIIILDILEYLWKQPKWLNKDRMIGNTGIYDYWFYIVLLIFFIDFWIRSLQNYIMFTIIVMLWWIISYLLTKKKYKDQIPLYVYAFFIISWLVIYLLI